MRELVRVIIPDNKRSLLRQELAIAFECLGFSVLRVHPDVLWDAQDVNFLPRLLAEEPSLLFSINFQGLEKLKQAHEVCRHTCSQIAIWCVDNPWNVLAAVKEPQWRELPLFVTDASFILPLEKNGAKHVYHLPLAACAETFSPQLDRAAFFPAPQELAPFVFVGRLAFPDKDSFFHNANLPDELREKAMVLLHNGKRPDRIWWSNQLHEDVHALWPGKRSRRASFGAEEATVLLRELYVAGAAKAGCNLFGGEVGVDIFGDDLWQKHLPNGGRLRCPVDYYARLPQIYAKARYSLCVTSLQLPEGLNQRHFDIWIAGGCCIMDETPGLRVFPRDLTEPVTARCADDIAVVVRRIEAEGRKRENLVETWRQYLLDNHTYKHRVQSLLTQMMRSD